MFGIGTKIISPIPEEPKKPNIFQRIISGISGAANNFLNPPPVKINITPPAIASKITPTPPPALIPNRISIPNKSGEGMYDVPQHVTEGLMKTMDPIGEATNTARMLYHPGQVTGTKEEKARGINTHVNYGENPQFITKNIDIPNSGGSIDRGLGRINNNTFNEMWNQESRRGVFPWRSKMIQKDIHSYNDMEDMNKNIEMIRLILERGNWDTVKQMMRENPNYMQWFAAPLDLRER
jgi:hypothetical protein